MALTPGAHRDIVVRTFIAATILVGCAGEEEPANCSDAVIYRIDRVTAATDGPGARRAALDLDGDRNGDNLLGELQVLLHQIFEAPFDLTAPANQHLASDAPWHIAVRRCSDDAFVVSFGHRDAIVDAHDTGGDSAGGLVETHGRRGAVPLSIFFDPGNTSTDPGWVDGLAAAASFADPGDAVELAGRLAIALPEDLSTERIIRPMVPFMDERAQTSFVRDFDANRDGRITFEEIRDNQNTRAILAPDLVLGDDQRARSLSVEFHATRD